jgi:prepilin peptidase CpaA
VIAFFVTTLFPLLLIVAGTGDALSMRIPNRLNLLIAVSFFPMAVAAGMPIPMMGLHIAAGFALLAAGYLLFAFGLFGGGDAKLLAAAGLWLGYPASANFIVLSALAGGGLAIAVGAWSLIKLDSEIRDGFLSRRLAFLKPDLPYGIALAVGGLIAFSQSWWMRVAFG